MLRLLSGKSAYKLPLALISPLAVIWLSILIWDLLWPIFKDVYPVPKPIFKLSPVTSKILFADSLFPPNIFSIPKRDPDIMLAFKISFPCKSKFSVALWLPKLSPFST